MDRDGQISVISEDCRDSWTSPAMYRQLRSITQTRVQTHFSQSFYQPEAKVKAKALLGYYTIYSTVSSPLLHHKE